ncbi:TetR/AcrR family transcriptional regulator [Rhizobium bangladeshense]|uniref:TetR/AcrR family transcriptional regulator n=2 Tax=Rhizobium bangladeshense TaxID=1138189 RepID=A0ABS7LLC1_9HYPH|nr:TetR/AcrR family transcriptional regulator [Rhizobium bangladeshense]MBX4873845.1 TetR/AcrR family transcriptional regulator [Rhizobium bangladeshense]MBX4884855.1 TetR/AcrR family transcriptional regulator [Rhizobium bangladeshense]MBY3591969.1 TetR/AcrR family transcriptional regulator [Rhizobium bangladeshense]
MQRQGFGVSMKRESVREKNKEDKLLRIKKAAFDLFLSKGFDDTTTREIATAAGVGMGTVFVYGETKRDLLFLIVNDGLEMCIAEARALISPEKSLLANLLIILRRHYQYFAENPVLSQAALREMYFYQSGTQAERFNRTRHALRHLLTDLIDEALKAGVISASETAEMIAQAIFAIYQVDLRIWLSGNELNLEDGTERLRRQIEIVMKGLAPQSSALRL